MKRLKHLKLKWRLFLKNLVRIMAFNVQKIMTFLNLQSLVVDEGFNQKQSIPSTNQGVRVDEVGDYIDIDESGTIGGMDGNRMVRRGVIVDGGDESIMRSALLTSRPSSCSIVTTGIKHDGSNVLPIIGDQMKNMDDTNFTGHTNNWFSVSRYVGYDKEEVIQVNSSGVVVGREWCTDETSAPTSLVATPDCSDITWNWSSAGEYLNPSFRVFSYGVDVSGAINGGTTQFTYGGNSTQEVYVRTYENHDGTGTYKQSSTVTASYESCLTSFSMGYVPSNTSSLACSGVSNGTYYHDGTGAYPVLSDRIHSTSGGNVFNGNSKYFKIIGQNKWMTIDSSGYVTSVGDC